jgi:hypothetical protein
VLLLPALAAAECGEEHKWEAAANAARVVGGDWAAVFAVYDRYDRCADPPIQDTLHRLLVTTLIQRWDRLPELQGWKGEKADLVGAVLSELSVAVPEQRTLVKILADSRCPPAQRALCKRISVLLENAGLTFEQLGGFCGGAQDAIAAVRSWSELYKLWLEYWRCDDGAFAEGFDAAVVGLFAERWSTLPQLAKLTGADPQFRQWVLDYGASGLDEPERYEKILANATRRCPKAHRALCDELAAKIRELHHEEQE